MTNFLPELFRGQTYDSSNFFLLAGPCVVESEELVMEVAEKVSTICKNLGIPYIFKASYKKANRTSASCHLFARVAWLPYPLRTTTRPN